MPQTQTFNDGIASFFDVANVSPPGKKPVARLVSGMKLRYCQRTVGYGRYWNAYQNDVTVSALIRCPANKKITVEHVVILSEGDTVYRIKQVQFPEDIVPPVMDLTLEIAGDRFESDTDS